MPKAERKERNEVECFSHLVKTFFQGCDDSLRAPYKRKGNRDKTFSLTRYPMLGNYELYVGLFIPLLGTELLFLPEALRVGHETRKDDVYQCSARPFSPSRSSNF